MLNGMIERLSFANLLLVVVVLFVGLSRLRNLRRHRRVKALGERAPSVVSPGPLGIRFIWGSFSAAKKNESLLWWTKHLENGPPNSPTVEANVAGGCLMLTTDPENIKALLATQFSDYGKGESFNRDWHEFLGDSIFSTDHEEWQQYRALIRPQFIKDRLSDLDTFERHVSVLLEKFTVPVVDVSELFHRFTLDVSTDFLLGRSTNSLQTGPIQFAYAFGEIQRIQNNIARAGPFSRFIPRGTFRKHLSTLNSFVEPFIEDALALSKDELEQRTKSDSGYTFLHALAAYTRDRKVLRDQLVAVLLAGRDTTANTLAWLFYELSSHPEVVAQLRKEIENVVGWKRTPTYDDLKNMKFLQNTLNETLRIYPVLPFNVRLALKDTTLPRGGGPTGDLPIGILKGTPVAYSIHALHLTRSIYPPESPTFPSPLEFAPSRWQHWQPKPWTYIPFNGGPRLCVGQQFALTEMAYTVVRILQRFAKVESGMNGLLRRPDHPERTKGKGSSSDSPLHRGTSTVNENRRQKSLAEEFCEGRELQLKTEIVLTPADKVNVTFYET